MPLRSDVRLIGSFILPRTTPSANPFQRRDVAVSQHCRQAPNDFNIFALWKDITFWDNVAGFRDSVRFKRS